jgi:hypothetical protein
VGSGTDEWNLGAEEECLDTEELGPNHKEEESDTVTYEAYTEEVKSNAVDFNLKSIDLDIEEEAIDTGEFGRGTGEDSFNIENYNSDTVIHNTKKFDPDTEEEGSNTEEEVLYTEKVIPHTVERVRGAEERVPRNSPMAALSAATPAMLTVAEKSEPPAGTQPASVLPKASAKRLPWRSTVVISALALTAALSAYALLRRASRGEEDAPAYRVIRVPSQIKQAPSAPNSSAVWEIVPLPSRRPQGLRAQPSPSHSRPDSDA